MIEEFINAALSANVQATVQRSGEVAKIAMEIIKQWGVTKNHNDVIYKSVFAGL